MVRSAAKNWKDVAVLTDAAQYPQVVAELKAKGQLSDATRFALSVAAFNRISQYDGAISNYLSSIEFESPTGVPKRNEYAAQANSQFVKLQDLRYGENPHQTAAFYRDLFPAPGSLVTAKQLQGKELSYNGVAYSLGAVQEGSYTFWGYEHMYYPTGYTNSTIVDTIAAQLYSTDAAVLPASMNVSRSSDGGNVTHN